jgi:hypothetical protein
MFDPIDPSNPLTTPRARLHHAIRRCFSSSIAVYYRNNPQWFDDERGRKGVSAMLALMHEILKTIDDYEVHEMGDHRARREGE